MEGQDPSEISGQEDCLAAQLWVDGCSWVVGAQGQVGSGGACFGLWKLGGNPDLGAGSWEVGFQSLCSSSSPHFVLVLSLAYVPFNLSSKCQDPENSSVDSDRK